MTVAPGVAVYGLRNYQPTAFMDGLPLSWVEALARDYRGMDYRVETGPSAKREGEGWLRVHGLKREVLWGHVNDPLGKPGEQETRSPQTIKDHKPKLRTEPRRTKKPLGRKPLPLKEVERRQRERREEERRLVEEEERRHLRPDGD